MSKKTKVCSKCKETKNVSEFYKNKRYKDGLFCYCSSCERARRKTYWNSLDSDKKDVQIKRHKLYLKENKASIKIQRKGYGENNKEKRNKYRRDKYKNDIIYKLACWIKNYCGYITRQVKKKKSQRSHNYLGCSYEEFKSHIESQWQEGMTWENHGSGDGKWQIDHIIPVDWYMKNSDDPWEANRYTNLQPLWAEENIVKRNKILDDIEKKV
jgi:hypothetical protein